MTLKQINKSHKCPICKTFGMKSLHKVHRDNISIEMNRGSEYDGHEKYTGISYGEGHHFVTINFYRCVNCYAEFMDDTQLKIKQKFSKNSRVWYEELEKIKINAFERLRKEQEKEHECKWQADGKCSCGYDADRHAGWY